MHSLDITTHAPAERDTREHILVIKHSALGDVILATAGFAALRAAHPQAHITLLTTKAYAPLLAQSPYFNEIWVDSKPRFTDRKAIARLRTMLRSRPWAWVYDLQCSTRTTLYQWLLARPWPRISNVSRWTSHGYTDPARHGKHALVNLRLQLEIAGIEGVGNPDLSWMQGEADRPLPALPARYALLVAGGAPHRPEKRWPSAQFAALAMELVAKGITPVLIGTGAEEAQLAEIAQRVPHTINLCNQTTIAQLAPLARGACLAVGNDTGPMHVIAASNCPSTVLFSHASNPVRCAPVGASVQILREVTLEKLAVDRVLCAVLHTARSL